MAASITIRPYRSEDAPALAEIFYDAVHRIGRRDYSPEQCAVWAPERTAPSRYETRAADGRVLLVATDAADEPIAYGDLEPDGHIDHLYCRPDHVGTGFGSALVDRLEAIARERGLGRLYVEASDTAKPLFLHKGFEEVERRRFVLRGVLIHNTLMAKML
jgi:putative acetyltransferase